MGLVNKPINTVSLFSGGGGLDLGFAVAGYNVVFSSDIDPYSCQTLELNSTKKPYLNSQAVVLGEDVNRLNGSNILSSVGLEVGQLDLVIGGPPCQAFSVFGRRKGLDDPRGKLIKEYMRLVQELQPAAFLFENVAGLKTIHDGALFEEMKNTLSVDGQYRVSIQEYDLADYGIPQFRRRVFFLGSSKGIELPRLHETHGATDLYSDRKPYVTVGDALQDMPEPAQNGHMPNHIGRDHSQRIVDRYTNLRFGERDPKTRINKLDPNRPSFTIIVGSDKGGGKGHVHPYQPREVTPRESARLQTFPDWWEFSGRGRHVIRQVGNAVPPLFAAQLAAHIKKYYFDCESELDYDAFIKLLELDYLAQR